MGDSECDFFLWRKPAKKVHSLAGPMPTTSYSYPMKIHYILYYQ
ncbi:MAG: hypothetical protein V4700_04355 [Pseudomonadota bacterium]